MIPIENQALPKKQRLQALNGGKSIPVAIDGLFVVFEFGTIIITIQYNISEGQDGHI